MDNGSTPLPERLRDLYRLLDRKRAAEAELVEINKAIATMQPGLVEAFEAQGIERLELDGIGTFSRRDGISVKVFDDARFYAWVVDSGRGGAIKQTIHHMTRDAMVREYVEDRAEPPPGVEIGSYSTIALRR